VTDGRTDGHTIARAYSAISIMRAKNHLPCFMSPLTDVINNVTLIFSRPIALMLQFCSSLSSVSLAYVLWLNAVNSNFFSRTHRPRVKVTIDNKMNHLDLFV